MRKLMCALMLGGLATCQAVTLSENGKPSHVIVVSDNSLPVLNTAAKELADHLKAVTGGEFQIVTPQQRLAGQKALIIEPVESKPDGIAITFDGDDIHLGGQLPRGPLYAVYTFLEDYVGIRWWTPTESYIPHKPTLDVPVRNHAYAPKLICREPFYKNTFDPVFASRLKANGHHNNNPAAYGGHMSIIGFVHTMFQFLPPAKYFKDHPEWYNMINGERTSAHYSQLCLTNEEMRKEFVKVCLQKIAENPTAGMISVSQNDGRGIDGGCQCPACKAIEEEEGSPSGPILRFVNAVAADIAKVYPDFLIETLAYRYTRKAPKITKPAPNVIIRLCSIEMNAAQPLESGPDNASFKKDIEEWSAISKQLYIWNYITNFSNYMLPHPNYRGLAKDIRFFVNHKTIGMFEQGDAGCTVGDFVRPRAWIVSHLLWNPDADEKQLAREFFNGYYGAAGPYLLAYIDYLCDTVEASGYNMTCYNMDVNGWMRPENLRKALELYAKAEQAVADDPVLAVRVRRERLSLDQVCLMSITNMLRKERFTGKKAVLPIADPVKLADEFVELTKNAGNLREGVPFGHYGETLRQGVVAAIAKSNYVPTRCKDLPIDRWEVFPVIGFNLSRIGTWVDMVDDVAAAQGRAVRMPTTHHEWAMQCPFTADCYDRSKPWRLTIRVRCEGASKEGFAVGYGLYDRGARKDMFMKWVPAKDCNGTQYVEITTEPFMMCEQPLLWFAPVNRSPEDVSHVYVDEAILIREP
ncbi:MAG: DUF4838 domain-containing protein [Lentisphaeria bacterium]|nr:DUF4838 domain-containing protein [Lentisphaeria bacterium]